MVRAVHCRSTHHLFAMDALPLVHTPAGQRLVGLILRYYRDYLKGATDPDTRICDFHNQIIHVEDGYWGGAPRVANQWYNRMLMHLRDGRYRSVARSAGILSHYFTDPIQPFHTASTDREALVHRPFERSVYQSYEAILDRWRSDQLRIVFRLGSEEDWLESAIFKAAGFAYGKFSPLVNSYRFEQGVKDASDGLDDTALATLAELFGLSITGWARVLDRVAQEGESHAKARIPSFSTFWPATRSTLATPFSLWLRRCLSCIEEIEMHELAKEYRETGELKEYLPAEVDIKRRVIKVHRDEKRYQNENKRRRAERRQLDVERERRRQAEKQAERELEKKAAMEACSSLPQLSPTDQLVKAPSIDRKTANLFGEMKIRTIGAFLTCDPAKAAEQLPVEPMGANLIRLWQVQASLMCFIPGLSELDAQLLAGAAFKSAFQIARSDPKQIRERIDRYSATASGREYLQGQPIPSMRSINLWIQNAQAVMQARAA